MIEHSCFEANSVHIVYFLTLIAALAGLKCDNFTRHWTKANRDAATTRLQGKYKIIAEIKYGKAKL
jgi:hypothetical protein